jgi:TusA-related sulfurtransferase
MHRDVDARGLACPEPVIVTKKNFELLNVGDQLTVIVDTEVAKENILRYAKSQKAKVSVSKNDTVYNIVITK